MSTTNWIGARLEFLTRRLRGFKPDNFIERVNAVSEQHNKPKPVIAFDMLWSAAFKDTAFQDYVDWDYAMLTKNERKTFMTHPLSNHLAVQFNQEGHREIFQDKIDFNRKFDKYLRRAWADIRELDDDQLRAFLEPFDAIIGKVPFSNSGHGVSRYEKSEWQDIAAFRKRLEEAGELLLEEQIQQHVDLAAVCPGTANTTRVTAFFDGKDVHIITMAQKFGRGQVSDQQTFGGFYTMLDLDGHALSRGYDSHDNVYETHPESGASIVDFQLPDVDKLKEMVDEVARVVPEVPYVGWDYVMGPDGPILVEGNWGVGVYENKPSVTGVRHGNRARFRRFMNF
ncbi:sugar-transfer associated ATP-grasp domain-containing protein [Gulosibacter molinativorax]|uniref:sugar-transfer associated ATP-grasp domain-containing protein n=1 Tax=Gulosibacter molinativorax TaxID=256821 RepID=UPI000418E925|nr:sugar-transfer associated ATP-grasp domain-containing protein [Gulosibacter molinativorax]QUY61569.1 Flagellar biosynthesis/type III secretory pathway protein [Gulosibacter molinativorax]